MLIHLEALKSCFVQREKRIEARPLLFSAHTEPRFSGLPCRGLSMAGVGEEDPREDLGWVEHTQQGDWWGRGMLVLPCTEMFPEVPCLPACTAWRMPV